MTERSYDGEPIDAAWQSDLKDAQADRNGKTVDATPKESNGGERTDFWPSEVPHEPFVRGVSEGQSVQSQVVEALAQFPDASNSRIAEYVDCSKSQVQAVRHKVSVFVPPAAVQFAIPAEPGIQSNRLAVYALDHEESRFDRDELEPDADTESSDAEEQSNGSATDIARRFYDEGEEAEEIAEDLGMNLRQVTGTLAQAERNQDGSEAPADAADVSTDSADGEDQSAEGSGSPTKRPSQVQHVRSTDGDSSLSSRLVGVVIGLVVGYLIGRRRGGDE